MQKRKPLPAEHFGIHRGVWYRVIRADDTSWDYFFGEGDDAKAGRVDARLGLLAAQRVKGLIDRHLDSAH